VFNLLLDFVLNATFEEILQSVLECALLRYFLGETDFVEVDVHAELFVVAEHALALLLHRRSHRTAVFGFGV